MFLKKRRKVVPFEVWWMAAVRRVERHWYAALDLGQG